MFENYVFSGGPENCDFNSIEWYALTLYYFGFSQIGIGHKPESYYRSCGSFRVYQRVLGENSQCSVQDLKQMVRSAYECYLLSVILYDSRRHISVESAFGVYPVTAFFFFIAFPVCSFMFVLGIMNLIVLRHMRKATDNGTGALIFHQLNVACDAGVTFLSMSPDIFVLGNVTTTVYHGLTGMLRCYNISMATKFATFKNFYIKTFIKTQQITISNQSNLYSDQ